MATYREKLEKLRSDLIGKLHVQPYIIYDDDTMQLLLDKKPKTIEELTKIKGFPAKGKRVSGFGMQIVAIFNNKDVALISNTNTVNSSSMKNPERIQF